MLMYIIFNCFFLFCQSSITSGIQITFYVGDTEDQMKVDSSTKPADVCNFFIKKHSLSVTICWALFESINNEIFGMSDCL